MTINLDDLVPPGMMLPTEPEQTTSWSKYQLALYEAAETTTDNLVVEAVAGSGKTTSILETMKRLRMQSGADVLFLAFNKSIQTELAARVPFGVTTKTLNALGHSVMMPHVKSRRIESYKPHNVLKDMLQPHIYQEYGWELAKRLSSARHHGIGIRTDLSLPTWQEFLAEGGMSFEDESQLMKFAEICRLAFDRMLEEHSECFDFDDQLYLPIFYRWTFPKFDVVFVDEAQDLSFINHMQLARLRDRGARIIAVGDSHQAIYAFRGADTRSMSNLAESFSARRLPLSICYRCGKSIVRAAQALVPHIEFSDASPEGTIVDHEEYPHPSDYEPGSMIMCRNNAPLFHLALQFLRERVPCHIVMDFAQDLAKLIDKMNVHTGAQLRAALERWRDREIAKATNLHRKHLIPLIEDKVDCLLPFCDEFPYAQQIKIMITNLAQSTVGPRLSTIHKAKGLEAKHAYILRPDLLPSERAETEEDRQQERNLQYVAITRAKEFLHMLPRYPQ